LLHEGGVILPTALPRTPRLSIRRHWLVAPTAQTLLDERWESALVVDRLAQRILLR
jgi:hypothetical protein